MKQVLLTVQKNEKLAEGVYRMTLSGDVSAFSAPGQFLNVALEPFYLRRPISVFDLGSDSVTIIYKTVGKGTEKLASLRVGSLLDVLTGLGNGYDLSLSGDKPLLIGGGVGIPPLYLLAKELKKQNKEVTAILGFNKKEEIFCKEDFEALGVRTVVATADGSFGVKGFVTDALPGTYSFFYACGPEPMLRAVFEKTKTGGQFSFEERMGCGFGACMGCSCKTLTGYKRVCRDGPVFMKEEILW